MGLIEDLATFMEMPVWFVGGFVGLAAMLIIMAFFMRFLKVRGLFLSATVMAVMFLNILIFAWPLWPVFVIAAVMLGQLGTNIRVSLNLRAFERRRPGNGRLGN